MTTQCRSQSEDGPITFHDGHEREMAKWAHHRLDSARRRAEGEQRHALADLGEMPCREAEVERPGGGHS